MDDNFKNAASYQLDQEILDARGIPMTVDEVAGLSTVKYSERVQSLKLSEEDFAFIKGLRRRIKNRLASQNSRRRNVEHLRRLTRELRAVRAFRDDALAEREALLKQRDEMRDHCVRLRGHVVQTLQERADTTVVPSIEIPKIEKEHKPKDKKETNTVITHPDKKQKNNFQCRIEKIVHESVNHLFKNDNKIFARTVFLDECTSNVEDLIIKQEVDSDSCSMYDDSEVLNLCIKEKKRSHGRKQLAPRRIAYTCVDSNDVVLDLKIKKESQ